MRTLFYTLILLVGIFSCKSVEKMVEKGEYDKAFSYAIDKLEGEKNKKTEYVKALEKAYFKLNSVSFKEIEKLNANVRPENWSRVLSIYKTIENRQERLDPLIPLVSENGYVASFDMKSYREEIRVAEDNTCLYYYNNAIALIERTEKTGDKIAAKNAYDELKKIERYKARYQDSDLLKDKALSLGLTTVHFEVYNDLRDFHGNNIAQDLLTLPVSDLDNLWFDYSIGKSASRNADFVVIVDLTGIDFSPERERVNTYSESKEILIRKDKVKEKRDSVDVWIEKEVYERVRADVTEIFREKKSELHGKLRVMHTRSKEYIKNIPINVYHDFNGYGCKFAGDERALTPESKKRMDNYLEFFPSDIAMAEDLSGVFKNAVMTEVKRLRFE
ncbi:MAG: hypothetical protein IPN86_02325 [Saprospiraceae bacterium]|nr:hypothetical protein [Saprospiraceae bacterium]